MSQFHLPSGLCFLECGCISSPSPFPGLLRMEPWHDASFRAPRLHLGSGRGQAGLDQGSAQPPASPNHMDAHPDPFLSAAWQGAVQALLSELDAARASGSVVHIIPSASRPASPRVRGITPGFWCSLPGRAAQGLGSCPGRLALLALGHGIVRGCAWQSTCKGGRDFALAAQVSKLLIVIPVCYLLPAATGDGFPLFLQAGSDCHQTLGLRALRR